MHKEINCLPYAIAGKKTKANWLIRGISFALAVISSIAAGSTMGAAEAFTVFVVVLVLSTVILVPVVLIIMVPFKYWGAFMRFCNSGNSTEIPSSQIGGYYNDPTNPSFQSRFNSDLTKR